MTFTGRGRSTRRIIFFFLIFKTHITLIYFLIWLLRTYGIHELVALITLDMCVAVLRQSVMLCQRVAVP